MARRKCRRRFTATEEDPMAGTANLVDAMLVIAVGLLVFLIISWNMQGVVMDQVQNQQASEVEQGEQLDNAPDVSESSGQGYTEMGTVYKDPKSGKLIMVEEN